MSAARTEGRRRSNWIPWTFVAGFGVIIIANTILAVFALGSFSGIETEHAYKTGLAYNDVLAAREAQAARGWRHEMIYVPEAGETGRIEITLTGAGGEALQGLTVVAQIGRPAHEGEDREIVLATTGGGTYSAALALPLKGQWQADISASGIGAPYHIRERFWVR